MRKVVTIEMTEDFVLVSVDCPDFNTSERALCKYSFPLDVINPRIALQIASLLSSDPTVNIKSPESGEEASN